MISVGGAWGSTYNFYSNCCSGPRVRVGLLEDKPVYPPPLAGQKNVFMDVSLPFSPKLCQMKKTCKHLINKTCLTSK